MCGRSGGLMIFGLGGKGGKRRERGSGRGTGVTSGGQKPRVRGEVGSSHKWSWGSGWGVWRMGKHWVWPWKSRYNRGCV